MGWRLVDTLTTEAVSYTQIQGNWYWFWVYILVLFEAPKLLEQRLVFSESKVIYYPKTLLKWMGRKPKLKKFGRRPVLSHHIFFCIFKPVIVHNDIFPFAERTKCSVIWGKYGLNSRNVNGFTFSYMLRWRSREMEACTFQTLLPSLWRHFLELPSIVHWHTLGRAHVLRKKPLLTLERRCWTWSLMNVLSPVNIKRRSLLCFGCSNF